ncbi:hypothetical protein L345_15342, partial [Ophiophagus hannah]
MQIFQVWPYQGLPFGALVCPLLLTLGCAKGVPKLELHNFLQALTFEQTRLQPPRTADGYNRFFSDFPMLRCHLENGIATSPHIYYCPDISMVLWANFEGPATDMYGWMDGHMKESKMQQKENRKEKEKREVEGKCKAFSLAEYKQTKGLAKKEGRKEGRKEESKLQ